MADRELIDVSDEVEALSEERQQVALLRAFRRLDVPFEILDDGTINITDEDVDLYSDEILEAYSDEMKKMVASDIFERLQEKGQIYADGVDEDGEIMWARVGA